MKRIDLLDYSRLLAALAVMAFHYFFNGILNGKINSVVHIDPVVPFVKYGYLGVELFFMISGYVIFFSSQGRTPGQFIAVRAKRLYPAFWVAMLFTALFAATVGGPKMDVSFKQVLANLTMVPTVFGYRNVDGVYWTLLFEIKFYLAVFLLLILLPGKKLDAWFIGWPLYIAAAGAAGLESLPLANGYYGFFAAGGLFAMLAQKRSPQVAAAIILSLYNCSAFSLNTAAGIFEAKGMVHSDFVIATTIFCFFLLFLGLSVDRLRSFRLPGAQLAGALTYPIYLIHAHIGYMLISTFANEENKLTVYAAVITFVFTMAYLIHIFVERRLDWYWRKLFDAAVRKHVDAAIAAAATYLARRHQMPTAD